MYHGFICKSSLRLKLLSILAKSFIVDVLQSSIYDSGYFPILSDNYNIFFMFFIYFSLGSQKEKSIKGEKS